MIYLFWLWWFIPNRERCSIPSAGKAVQHQDCTQSFFAHLQVSRLQLCLTIDTSREIWSCAKKLCVQSRCYSGFGRLRIHVCVYLLEDFVYKKKYVWKIWTIVKLFRRGNICCFLCQITENSNWCRTPPTPPHPHPLFDLVFVSNDFLHHRKVKRHLVWKPHKYFNGKVGQMCHVSCSFIFEGWLNLLVSNFFFLVNRCQLVGCQQVFRSKVHEIIHWRSSGKYCKLKIKYRSR